MGISYCISVFNESDELNNLLNQLLPNFNEEEDEVIILIDTPKVTPEVDKVIDSHIDIYPYIKVIEGALNNDFASFKNEFLKSSSKDYIIQIDCDEILSEELLTNLKPILECNSDIEMFSVPRENFVEGITSEYISKWRWNIDEKNRINYPDGQMRLFKNNGKIKWQNKVHEVLVGYKTYTMLPYSHYLIHRKTLERQITQNELYSKI